MAASDPVIARLTDSLAPSGATPPPEPPDASATPPKPRKRKAGPERKATSNRKTASNRKPVSKRQLEANRRNAAKSTGPKTPDGKAASRENATKHNLCARRIVLACEDEAEFRRHEQAIIRGWNPANEDELDMAKRIARAGWILDRAEAVYNAMADLTITASKTEHGYPYPADRSRDLEFLAAGICHTDPQQALLVERYVVAAERTFHRHREALRKLQNDRFRRERATQPTTAAELRPLAAARAAAGMPSSDPGVSVQTASVAASPAPDPAVSANENGFVAQSGDVASNSLKALEMRTAEALIPEHFGTPSSQSCSPASESLGTRSCTSTSWEATNATT